MTATNAVLVISNDAQLRDRLAAPLEWSYPNVDVETAAGFDGIIDQLAADDPDCVVTDVDTVQAAPAILQAARERHPELTLLVLSEYETDRGDGAAIMEVVEYLDGIGEPGSDDAFAGWVANSVVRTPGGSDAGPPGGNRPEDVVRDVKRALVDAESPMDIEAAVCEQLTLGGRYAFSFIGEYDRGEGQVVPWVTAGIDDWPVSTTFPVGTGGVVDRALRTREVQVVQDVTDHSLTVPWAQAASDYGCESAIVAPLYVEDELYGILGVYSRDPDGFDDMAVSGIEEISRTVSYVLDTMAIRGRIDQQERTLKRYERLVETVGDGMYALDSDGHFMTVNNGLMEMTGYSREGLLGEHISIVLDDEAVDAGRQLVREMYEAERMTAATKEVQVIPKTGDPYPGEAQIALLPFDDELRGTVGVVRDITERKRRERELERQNERLEAFASIVSHDLRNPLGVSQGYLDLAREAASPEVAAYLEHVGDGLDRMEDIVGDVLALARQGQTVTETEPVTLEGLAREAWSNVETEDATLEVDDDLHFGADRSRLLRSFENLFRNSVEHGSTSNRTQSGDAIEHGGGDVTVTVGPIEHRAGGFRFGTSDDASSTGFYVADDGPGMPAEIREHAFDSEFTTSDDGLGIGLWVVREVASAHGWHVDVVENDDGGARFEFTDVEAV
ncbi:PAS domain S-box protein [Halorubellus sp. JP-L1]|uniref:sensor histidine kinase n=1 Tax=Halorubellus sp. JP-L1 TaxID=2715753 RepID=UPI00140E8F8D|nr:PAS domain-containing sensor histidine kinase [Halorubellus sp. JP-L1]NHN40497.1 PAS domain S-box protein [Halorubellus sp. JP-L1]